MCAGCERKSAEVITAEVGEECLLASCCSASSSHAVSDGRVFPVNKVGMLAKRGEETHLAVRRLFICDVTRLYFLAEKERRRQPFVCATVVRVDVSVHARERVC